MVYSASRVSLGLPSISKITGYFRCWLSWKHRTWFASAASGCTWRRYACSSQSSDGVWPLSLSFFPHRLRMISSWYDNNNSGKTLSCCVAAQGLLSSLYVIISPKIRSWTKIKQVINLHKKGKICTWNNNKKKIIYSHAHFFKDSNCSNASWIFTFLLIIHNGDYYCNTAFSVSVSAQTKTF